MVVNGNLQPYAEAYVVDCIYVPNESRWGIILEWPKAPGGPSVSRVWDTDEGKGWFRYSGAN